jgi:hypothetical protein
VKDEFVPRIKSFIKSYHEIRFNLSRSKYIPNFSNYTRDQKIDVINLITGKDVAVIATWDVQSIDEMFLRITGKEVSLLEKDLIEDFS